MEANVYWNHSVNFPDADGVAWVEASGPAGSVAVGGGGYGSINTGGLDDIPFLPIVATKPNPTNPEAWAFGVLSPPCTSPDTPAVKIHCFVVVLENLS